MRVPAVPAQDAKNAAETAARALPVTCAVESASLRSVGEVSSFMCQMRIGYNVPKSDAASARNVSGGRRDLAHVSAQVRRRGGDARQGQDPEDEQRGGQAQRVAQAPDPGRADPAADQ